MRQSYQSTFLVLSKMSHFVDMINGGGVIIQDYVPTFFFTWYRNDKFLIITSGVVKM